MQEINRETLIAKASALLADGTVNRVLGWKAGEFAYDVTPTVFRTAEDMEKDFVFNGFCGANFSKYLVRHKPEYALFLLPVRLSLKPINIFLCIFQNLYTHDLPLFLNTHCLQ